MNTKYREVIGGGDQSVEFQIIQKSLISSATRITVQQELVELVGPLDAKERWELLIEAHFPDNVRSHVYTGAPPWQVAFQLIERILYSDGGYPSAVYLLQLVGVENIEAEGFDANRVQQAMNQLLQSPEDLS
ncbi:hypothetical protein KBD69_00655 [Candidatus Woesebacteria bacterium]|nr:hypothetical protein [Candidatus Woesebacteria bacterium]